jgi:hypothetical protein
MITGYASSKRRSPVLVTKHNYVLLNYIQNRTRVQKHIYIRVMGQTDDHQDHIYKRQHQQNLQGKGLDVGD